MRGMPFTRCWRCFCCSLAMASSIDLAGAAVGTGRASATIVSSASVATPAMTDLLDRFTPAAAVSDGASGVQVKVPIFLPNVAPPSASQGTAAGALSALETAAPNSGGAATSGPGTPSSAATAPADGALAPSPGQGGTAQPIRNADGSVSINITGSGIARVVTRMPDGLILVDFN
jgi:hypothetical protein